MEKAKLASLRTCLDYYFINEMKERCQRVQIFFFEVNIVRMIVKLFSINDDDLVLSRDIHTGLCQCSNGRIYKRVNGCVWHLFH